MAGLDKTYVKSYEEYKALCDWAKGREYTKNGFTVRFSDSIYEWTKESFDGNTNLPVMNTSSTTDYALIKECPLGFVRKRLYEVYGNGYIESVLDGTHPYDTYVSNPGKKVVVKRLKGLKHRDYITKCWNGYRGKYIKSPFWVQHHPFIDSSDDMLSYNDNMDRWFSMHEFGDGYTNAAHNGFTIKALVRKIRKWNLPKGTVLRATGAYADEELVVYIK